MADTNEEDGRIVRKFTTSLIDGIGWFSPGLYVPRESRCIFIRVQPNRLGALYAFRQILTKKVLEIWRAERDHKIHCSAHRSLTMDQLEASSIPAYSDAPLSTASQRSRQFSRHLIAPCLRDFPQIDEVYDRCIVLPQH